MKTYARYTYTKDITARRIGNGWIEVSKEYQQWFPSGKQTVLVLNGCAVKAKFCKIIQVF